MVQHIAVSRRLLDHRSIEPHNHLADPAKFAQAKLAASPYAPLRRLTCDSHEGVLSIRGQVSSFYLKQLAQTAVRGVPGVEEVNNQVQVV